MSFLKILIRLASEYIGEVDANTDRPGYYLIQTGENIYAASIQEPRRVDCSREHTTIKDYYIPC